MPALILIATPYPAFADLLRLSLEEQGHYQVRLAATIQETRASLNRQIFQMAIIDFGLQDEPLVAFAIEVMAQFPNLRVVVIPPENNPNHPALGGLIPHGYLSRPFYLPDLLELTERLLDEKKAQNSAPNQETQESLPAWLEDNILLQGYLEKQLASSDAVAALVGQNGKLRANAGILPLQAALELNSLLLRYWDREEKTDLMRFIRLSSIKGDYLTYATTVMGEVVLMMAYEPAVSISQVRPQTRAIAQRMASDPPPGYLGKNKPGAEFGSAFFSPKNGSDAKPAVKADSAPHNSGSETSAARSLPPRSAMLQKDTEPQEAPISFPTPPLDEDDSDSAFGEDGGGKQFDLASLLGTVPSPDPPGENLASNFGPPASTLGWVREAGLWDPSPRTDRETPTGSDGLILPEQSPQKPDQPLTAPPEAPVRDVRSGNAAPPLQITLPGAEPAIDPLGDTQPHLLSTVSHISQLEPVSPALSLLNYTCVLIPRMPQHYLTGELADRLAQWVQQFCLAFGWRLEGISIRPDYLQWTVQVPPSVSPGNLIRIIRQRTSSSIFGAYQHLKEQNPSGDFWAVGYLIVSGSQPPSAQLLRDYIQQTRKRQGILKP